jgi:hypothetical protein
MAAGPQEMVSVIARYDRIYDLYRNCILNELYYGRRLKLYSRLGFWLEIMIVIGSGTSGISGWFIWTKYPQLGFVWGVIAAVSVLLAALKPAFKTDTHLKRYSSLFSAYRQLALSMQSAVEEIAENSGIRPGTEREIDRIRTRHRNLSVDDDPSPPTKLVTVLQDEVNTRVPPSSFFYPSAPPPVPLIQADGEAIAGDAEGVDVRIDPVEPWPTRRRKTK